MRFDITIDTCNLPFDLETMGTRSVVFGFVAGSLATALVLSWWHKKKEKDQDSEDGVHRLRTKLLTTASQRMNSKSIAMIGPTSSFLTDIVRELWTYINVAGGDTIRASVEPYFKLYLPGPLQSLHFTKVDLGTNPLQLDNLHVRSIQNGTVQVEMEMIWNGNGDIQLQTDGGMVSFGVQNIKLCGQFCLWLKPLTNTLPVVSGIQYAYINPPHIELNFTGLAAVADLAVIDQAVGDSIQASLLSYVLPNKGVYKMMATNNFLDTYHPPVGVVRVTACQGRGFVIEKKLLSKDDIPDVYLNITLGTHPVWRTRTIHDNVNPKWDESKEFVLHDRAQKITVHAWDYDKGSFDPDDDLGSASALVSEILLQPNRKLVLALEPIRSQAFVTLQCDILPWTTDLSSLGSNNSRPSAHSEETQVDGLLVVLVNRGFQIPVPRKEVCSFVNVTYATQEFRTKQVADSPGYDGLNPLYETAFEIPLLPGMGEEAKVQLELMNVVTVNDKEPPKEQVLGALMVDFADLRAAKDHTLTEKKPIGKAGAAIEYRVSLCGVQRTTASSTSEQYEPGATPTRILPTAALASSPSPAVLNGTLPRAIDFDDEDDQPPKPIGKVRLTVVKARGLNISHELFNIDIPDAYCDVKFGASEEVWRTSTQSNTCNPAWNESKQHDLLDHSQVIALQLLDQNERSYDPDINLGETKTTVGKVLLAGGSMDMELTKLGRPTGIFVTLKCELVVD